MYAARWKQPHAPVIRLLSFSFCYTRLSPWGRESLSAASIMQWLRKKWIMEYEICENIQVKGYQLKIENMLISKPWEENPVLEAQHCAQAQEFHGWGICTSERAIFPHKQNYAHANYSFSSSFSKTLKQTGKHLTSVSQESWRTAFLVLRLVCGMWPSSSFPFRLLFLRKGMGGKLKTWQPILNWPYLIYRLV